MMREMLEKCEKALAEYLETKRVAYPRFYFVAPADLLDILSKGSNPQAILKHLPKCFDNVKTLEFQVAYLKASGFGSNCQKRWRLGTWNRSRCV
eukprot:3055678-Rhodomonas_salina.10